jgi:hypothetical protein
LFPSVGLTTSIEDAGKQPGAIDATASGTAASLTAEWKLAPLAYSTHLRTPTNADQTLIFSVVFDSEPYEQRIIIYMSASATGQPHLIRPFLCILGWMVAWGWALLTIIGGLGLIITLGPWPPTNGWFALFSGWAACPMTGWRLRRHFDINFPGWARFVVASAIILLSRLALTIEGRGTFLPNFR